MPSETFGTHRALRTSPSVHGTLRAGCPPHSSQVTEPLPGRPLPRMEELGTKAGGGQPSVFILNKQKTKRNKQQRGGRMRQSAGELGLPAQGQAQYLQGNRTARYLLW